MNASGWTALDATYFLFGIGFLAVFLSVIAYLALRGRDGDEKIRSGIATWSTVSSVRGGCIVAFIVGVVLIVASVLFYLSQPM